MHNSEDAQLPAVPLETTQFQTMEEIAEYRSGNSIECLLCGKHYQVLNSHLIKIHDIDPFEYRRRFGIPASYSLASERFRLRHAAIASRNTKAIEALIAHSRAFDRSGQTTYSRDIWVPAMRKYMRELNKDKWVDVQRVAIPCCICGADVIVRQTKKPRPIRCLNCATGHNRSSRLSYWRNKWRPRKARLTPDELSRYKTPFQTKQEVDDYLSGESIDCLLCGDRLQRLNMHLKHDHAMTPDEYRVKFGIPFTRPLSTPAARFALKLTSDKKRLMAAKAEAEKNRTTPSRKTGPRIVRRSAAPCSQESYRRLAKAGGERLSQRVTVACPKCGAEFETTAGHAKRRPPCLDCATPASRQGRLWKMAIKAQGPQAPPAHYDVPFQTMEQVDAYLSGDKIQCLVCGDRMQTLHKHLHYKHGMTCDEYRIQFGIPYKRGLQSAKHKALASASMTPEDIERIRRAGRERQAAIAAGAKTPRSTKPIIAAVRDQLRKAHAKGGQRGYEKIPVPCSKCGITVEVIRMRATRPAYCFDCSPSQYMRLWHARKKLEAQQAKSKIETPVVEAQDMPSPSAA